MDSFKSPWRPDKARPLKTRGFAGGEIAVSKPRVLIVADHRILAEEVRSLLEPEFEVVSIA
jgi:hypothetical protein